MSDNKTHQLTFPFKHEVRVGKEKDHEGTEHTLYMLYENGSPKYCPHTPPIAVTPVKKSEDKSEDGKDKMAYMRQPCNSRCALFRMRQAERNGAHVVEVWTNCGHGNVYELNTNPQTKEGVQLKKV